MTRKGFYFSFDALLALSVITASLFLVMQSSDTATDSFEVNTLNYREANLVGQDSMRLASSQSFQDFNDTFKEKLVNETVMEEEDLNRTVVDGISLLWAARNNSYAREAAKRYFKSKVPEGYNFRVQINESGTGSVIYETGNISDNASVVSSVTRLVSGHRIDRPSEGYQARATLSSVTKNETKTVFFGGYVGDGDITYNVTVENLDTVLNVTLEGDFAGPFDLEINGVGAGTYSPSYENLSSDSFHVCSQSFNPSRCDAIDAGQNEFDLKFNNSENRSVGGGFLKITYNTTDNLTVADNKFEYEKKKIPGIDGLINYYSSFSVPGEINSMEANLHYKSENNTIFMRIANATVYKNRTNGERRVRIENESLHGNITSAGLNYSGLSQETIPLRIGLENIGNSQKAIADSVSVIDDSGSMCDGWSCDPDDKLPEAKNASRKFVDIILNATGNRAGIVGYDDSVTETHELSTDQMSLNQSIDSLDADGSTCIACGILEATDIVSEPKEKVLVGKKSSWLYNNSYLESTPPDLDGNNWKEIEYNDTGWNEDNAILGNSSSVDTEIKSNGSVYFRKKFYYEPDRQKNVTVALRADDAAIVFINGETVANLSGENEGMYWNLVTGSLKDEFWHRFDSFERASFGSNWTDSGGVEIDSKCGSDDGTESAVFDGRSDSTLRTESDDGKVPVKMTYKVYQPGGNCEDPDPGEDLVVEYNDSGTWKEIQKHEGDGSSPSAGNWEEYTVEVPQTDRNKHTGFRFRYPYTGYDDYWAVDSVNVTLQNDTEVEEINESILIDGENVVTARLENDGTDHKAEFDLQMNTTLDRKRSMIVMSDGKANQGPSGYVSSDLSGPVPNNGNCDSGSDDPCDDAIKAACEAQEEHNITVYTVGFGDDVDNKTLEESASCGLGEYYYSDTGELEETFREISNDILEASFRGQTLEVSDEGEAEGKLFDDSYLAFNYTANRSLDFGEFRLKQSTERFGGSVDSPKNGTFNVPNGTEPVSGSVTSYSGNKWTDRATINYSGNRDFVYRLWRYNRDYGEMGDPFKISIPGSKINDGPNRVSVNTAFNETDTRGGSPDNRIFYTLKVKGSVGYGELFDNESAATEDAKERLEKKLDLDGDGSPDVSLEDDDVSKSTSYIGDLPFLWGPASIKLVVWDE